MKSCTGGTASLLLGFTAVFLGCVVESPEAGKSSDLVESAEAEEDMDKAPQAPPPAWKRRQNTCETLSFYSVNPAYNPGAERTHLLCKYKRLFYTTGEIVKGWVPVYSAGQEEWHTGWVRQECLVDGWPHDEPGCVIVTVHGSAGAGCHAGR